MSARGAPNLAGLGAFIRSRRKRLRLTQTQLGERLGWSQERVSVIENGRYGVPSLHALIQIAEALDAPFADILEAVGYPVVAGPLSRGASPSFSTAASYALQRLLAIDALSLHDALSEASDLLAETMGAEKVDAFMYDASTESLIAVGTSATPMGRRQHALGLHREPLANGGRAVQVYESGQPFYTPQADQDTAMIQGVVQALGVRSFLAVPLRPHGTVSGVLAAASTHPDRFSLEERDFFEAAAQWVGMVIQRAELTEAITRTAAEDARHLAARELVTLLAHDLRNYLTPLKGRVDFLRRRMRTKEREGDLADLDQLALSLAHMDRLINELLDSARLDQGIFSLSRQAVDLVPLIQETCEDLGIERSHLDLILPATLVLDADPGRLRQILANLLNNAMTYSPPDVPIVVEARTEWQDDDEWAVITVRDAGPGIPQERLPTIFDRFSSGTGSMGLGLGLYIARGIAEAHGGTLTVSSIPDQGAAFSLTVPRSSRS